MNSDRRGKTLKKVLLLHLLSTEQRRLLPHRPLAPQREIVASGTAGVCRRAGRSVRRPAGAGVVGAAEVRHAVRRSGRVAQDRHDQTRATARTHEEP